MHYVYLLKSEKENWKYIGSCADLRKRFFEHSGGKVRSTKSRKPYMLEYYEAYASKATALKREIELKSNNSEREKLYKRIFIN
ncbi:MAG: GIY-YIG nuclease family protein [Candidatus Portnoybacteria bacterium]|nr:GIY-YIG nuclease family protein [Candidatus Portnoybacteria bacterium]MDD4982828.1 GIY-YIG nuclease family protein [Candidatus Portnoybacteria bacterium]